MSDTGIPVVVRLQGGLGNQLFQCAAGMTVARSVGGAVSVVGPAEVFEHLHPLLDSMGIRQVESLRPLERSPMIVRQAAPEAFSEMPKTFLAWTGRSSGYIMDGYFQHPSWFEATAPIVADSLRRLVATDVVPDVGRGHTVVSIRRGDYEQLGWTLPLDYYSKALSVMPDADLPIWVVCDAEDTSHVVANWLGEQGFMAAPSTVLPGPAMRRDLALLARADQVIMSNSTFCWWGTLAGDRDRNRSRWVSAPTPWLPLPGSSVLIDIGWHKVPFELPHAADADRA